MVGNESDAALALAGGGAFIGDGSFRICRRIGDVVYKIEWTDDEIDTSLGYICHDANEDEYLQVSYLSRLDLPPFISIPPVSQYDIGGVLVNAMPYIHGKLMGECYCVKGYPEPDHDTVCIRPSILGAIQSHTGLCDLGYGNVIFADGVYHIVDCQS